MRRAALVSAFMVAASTVSGIARAQTAVPIRDGQVNQAMIDTLYASLDRRGITRTDPISATTATRYNSEVDRLETACATSGNVPAGDRTYQQLIKCLDSIPTPTKIGKGMPGCDGQLWAGATNEACPNYFGGGSFGGGGAGASWTAPTCDDLKFEFDADGFLIIPSTSLKTGGPLIKGTTLKIYVPSGRPNGNPQPVADSPQASALRYLHLLNMGRDRRDWYGAQFVIGNTTYAATVAWVDGSGVVHHRTNLSVGPTTYTWAPNSSDVNCPQNQASGGDFHFYGETGTIFGHAVSCIEYAPNSTLGRDGYAMNERTTLNWKSTNGWPVKNLVAMDPAWQQCLLDPEFLARLTDAVYKSAANQPGYDGAPYRPVETTDARPGDSKVADLGDDPSTGATHPTAPSPHVDDPPPSNTGGGSTGSSGGSGTINVDFGNGPSDPQAPTMASIMDPVANWFPSIPQLTLNTSGAACPTWDLDVSAFLGASGHFVMDKQCELSEQARANLGALMLVVWGIAAAAIILRA